MLWKKPPQMHYTDMCIYIDENVPKIVNAGENPQIEDTIYNYLWLLVKALAIKRHMFEKFSDYDPYAFYSANRLYFALVKNQLNQGKIIKGKLIRPIKSCLNYTKALLNPMRIEYQRESFRMVISEEFVSKKFDAFAYKEQLKNDIKNNHEVISQFSVLIKDSFSRCGDVLDEVLSKSPFNKKSADYKNLKISVLLNCFYALKNKNKLDMDPTTIYTWRLPKSMQNYIRIFLKEFYNKLKLEVIDCYQAVNVSDDMAEKILTYQETENYEE